jgi:hypothetical protein
MSTAFVGSVPPRILMQGRYPVFPISQIPNTQARTVHNIPRKPVAGTPGRGNSALPAGNSGPAIASPIEARYTVLRRLKQANRAETLKEECTYLQQARQILGQSRRRTATREDLSKTGLDEGALGSYVQAELRRNLYHQGIDYGIHSRSRELLPDRTSEPTFFSDGIKAAHSGERRKLFLFAHDELYLKNRKKVLRRIDLDLTPYAKATLAEKRANEGKRRTLESILPTHREKKVIPPNQSSIGRALTWLLHHKI